MKKVGNLFIIFGIFFVALFFKDDILKQIRIWQLASIQITEFRPNKYYSQKDYAFFQNTDDFIAKDKKHLINIFYTIVNSGMDKFLFKCDLQYVSCLEDAFSLVSSTENELNNINNFVKTYNSFKRIDFVSSELGFIDLTIHKIYKPADIELIDKEIQRITKNITLKDKTDIIRYIHDYIIDKTKYDQKLAALTPSQIEEKELLLSKNKSDVALGPLFTGYALCGGYTDTMALFLDHYNIENIKITNITDNIYDKHIWNAVKINDSWVHLDLTWDDPVVNNLDDAKMKTYDFFLINSNQLFSKDKVKHTFNKNFFPELQ